MKWLDRAHELYQFFEKRGHEEGATAAYKALSFFVEARECRRTYKALINPSCKWLSQAAKEHRKGVKAYRNAVAILKSL